MPTGNDLKSEFEYFSTHPPRCIKDFSAHPNRFREVLFDGRGQEINPVFKLQCKCGHDKHYVLGYYMNSEHYNTQIFVSPLLLKCQKCDKQTECFDTEIHGYDAELGYGSASYHGKGEPTAFICPECGVQPFEIYTRFSYPDELFHEDFDDMRGREQDLFDWFFLLGVCSKCSQLREITDFECA